MRTAIFVRLKLRPTEQRVRLWNGEPQVKKIGFNVWVWAAHAWRRVPDPVSLTASGEMLNAPTVIVYVLETRRGGPSEILRLLEDGNKHRIKFQWQNNAPITIRALVRLCRKTKYSLFYELMSNTRPEVSGK